MIIKNYSNKRPSPRLQSQGGEGVLEWIRYAKWGAVTYLSDMHMLPNEILRQPFSKGWRRVSEETKCSKSIKHKNAYNKSKVEEKLSSIIWEQKNKKKIDQRGDKRPSKRRNINEFFLTVEADGQQQFHQFLK